MFNLKIPIDENNLEILFANALVENLRYGIISLDTMFNTEFEGTVAGTFQDEHTFYFYHMQSVLTAQGNIWNVLFDNRYEKRIISENRILKLREIFGIDIERYPLVGNKAFRNTNEHFDARYYEHGLCVGDYNIIDSHTDKETRDIILNTPHLRTIDIENWQYITCDWKKRQIILDLRKLRDEMYDLLMNLCRYDVRTRKIDRSF